MIPIKFKIKREGLTYGKKEWGVALRMAWQKVAEFWHGTILGKHFEEGAVQEYGYSHRTTKYRIRKRKKFGHDRPLVFTGNLEKLMKRTRDIRVGKKGGYLGADIVLHGPSYLYAYHKGTQVNKAAELRAISKGDAQKCAQVMDQKLVETSKITIIDLTNGHGGGLEL